MIDELLERLRANQPSERSSAARKLGAYYNDPRIVRPLIKVLSDPDAEVRAAAAYSLGKVGYMPRTTPTASQAIEKLVALTEDESEEVIASAIYALGQLGDTALGAKLLPFLNRPNDPDVKIRNIAITALCSLRYQPALPYFYRLLDDPDPGIRHDAMSALLSLRKHFAVDVERILEKMLGDSNPLLRNNAKVMLEIIREEQSPR